MSNIAVALYNADIYIDYDLILKDVNFTINKGEMIYLVGRRASGKSALFKTLIGEYPLKTGRGEINNFNLHLLSPKEIPYLRRSIGIISLEYGLVPELTILENMKLVFEVQNIKVENKYLDKIAKLLNKFDLIHYIDKHPIELSMGQQQKVLIARALLNSPKLLLADELTQNMDPETSDSVMQEVQSLIKSENVTVLNATSDYIVINRFPSRILKAELGKIIDSQSI